MIWCCVAALVFASPIAEPFRSFERLESAGYVDEVDSLFEALHDDRRRLCGDAAFHLRDRIDATACSALSDALRAAMRRDDLGCILSVLRRYLEVCENPQMLDEVYHFAKEVYWNREGTRLPPLAGPLAGRILVRLHDAKGYDVFDESLDTAVNARSLTSRSLALSLLLDNYSHRLCREDVERMFAEYLEDTGESLVYTWTIQGLRDQIDNAVFGCEGEDEGGNPDVDNQP